LGAHPDDCEIRFAGTAALFRQAGHYVRFVSVTNGNTGHHEIGGVELARRRAAEAQQSSKVLGIDYQILDIQSNELEPCLPYRKRIIQLIREVRPDVIATHRPWDYHPDHRYTSQLVQDASYAVTVPGVCPLTPHLRKTPVIVYLYDSFQTPNPFRADVALCTDEVIEKKLDMMHCHASQFYEWLPYNAGCEDEVPESDPERRQWLGKKYKPQDAEVADKCRGRLVKLYGQKRGKKARYAEAFQGCEYGASLTRENLGRLFPFFAGK
jgi:LmbE family N-acetylglucosaminyl deacetylase